MKACIQISFKVGSNRQITLTTENLKLVFTEKHITLQESKTNITVSSLHEQMPGVSERIVVITGQIAEIVAALRLLLKKLQESRHYSRLSSVPVSTLCS